MFRKSMHYCVVTFLMVAVTLVAACSPSVTTVPTEVPIDDPVDDPIDATADAVETEPAKEPVTLELWILDRVGTEAMDTVKTVVDQWAAETGNTVIITEGNQFEMLNKIPVAIPAGEGPDLFMNINNYVGGDYSAQLIVPLEDYLPDEEKAKYAQGALDSFTLDGHLLGIPFAADTMALVYNKALVETAPTTMDELVSMSKSLTQGDQYGFLYQIDSFYYSYPFVAAYGGYIFKWTGSDYDVTDIGLANEGAIEGLTYITDLVNEEGLMPFDTTADVMNSLFTEGKVGMIITNPAMVPSYKDAGIDIGVAPIPTTPNGGSPKPFATYTGFSVSSESENTDAAADLAIYLGVHLPLPLYQANNGNIPVYESVINDPSLQSNPEFVGWVSQMENSEVLPSINEMNFVWGPATTAFQAAVHGDETVEKSLTDAQALILQTIEENN
jgi:arabinogalactan oligomer/maltooligosaccharide transport system substrate-binding protein